MKKLETLILKNKRDLPLAFLLMERKLESVGNSPTTKILSNSEKRQSSYRVEPMVKNIIRF